MKLLAFLFLVFLSGCGAIDRTFTSWTGGLTEKCHRGIIFVQSDSGLAWLGVAGGTKALGASDRVVYCDAALRVLPRRHPPFRSRGALKRSAGPARP